MSDNQNERKGGLEALAEAASAADREAPQRLYGLVAEFEDVDTLLAACSKVRDAGYTKWDALTPFPVHGIDEAMGIRPTILPWLTLGAGLSGAVIALVMQWYTNAVDYPFIISGKPLFALPPAIPVTFEVIVLLAAFTTFIGMMVLNMLPELFHPLFRTKIQPRTTDDRFAIYIESADKLFQRQQVELMLTRIGASALEPVMGPEKRAAIPFGIHAMGIIGTAALLVPPGAVVMARYSFSDKPRIHPIQDMDFTPALKAQAEFRLFRDRRASFKPVDGTIRRGNLREDRHLYEGMDGDEFARGFPMAVTEELLLRGQERYSIYCAVCHGLSGDGDGLAARRAELLTEAARPGMGWVLPTSFYEEHVLEQPEGELYHSISYGVRNMKGYAAQITPEDRWAIIAYLRALQRSRTATLNDVPADVRQNLVQ